METEITEKDLTEVYQIFEQANKSIKDVTDIVKQNIDIRNDLQKRDEALKEKEKEQATRIARELAEVDQER